MSARYSNWWNKLVHKPADQEIERREMIIKHQISAIDSIVEEFHNKVKKDGRDNRAKLAKQDRHS